MPVRGVVEEGARLLHVDGDVDADFTQLGLDLLSYSAGSGEVAAHHVAVGELDVEPVGETGLGQQRLAWSRLKSYHSSPSQPPGMEQGVKWEATDEPGG